MKISMSYYDNLLTSGDETLIVRYSYTYISVGVSYHENISKEELVNQHMY